MILKLNNGDYIGHPNMLSLPKGPWPQEVHWQLLVEVWWMELALPMVMELLKVVISIILLKHEAFCQLSTLLWNSSTCCKKFTKMVQIRKLWSL